MYLLSNLSWKWKNRRKKLDNYFKRIEMSSVNIVTKHAPWVNLRDVIATESALGSAEKKGIAVPSPSDSYKIPEAMSYVEVRVSANTEGRTGVMHFYGARWKDDKHSTYDDIALIGSVAMTVGAQVSTLNNKYVHIMTPTDRWITEIKVADNTGNNGMSRLAFDASGYDVFFIRLTFAGDTQWLIEVSGWG